ncbi:hydrolase [Melghirimyces profundicolus]|uniref:hydrolase n=1 Tax=Melghirimyces profundicolus TaxID=1242148 RepID=UPI0011B27A66|nr:hydrolase [Melghirimyces profundicolus]
MSKRKYYVALHSGEIMGELLQNPTDSSYEFEIEATDEEARRLNRLLGNNAVEDMETFWDAHIPYLYHNQARENEGYDRTFRQIYEMVYRLGTPETKRQIEQLGLLDVGRDSRDPEGPIY